MPFGSWLNRFRCRPRPVNKTRAFTLLLVPHSGRLSKHMRLPTWLLKAAALSLVLFLGGLSWLGYDYFRLRANEQELARLKIVTRKQAQQIESLAEEAAQVQERLLEVDELDAEVRALVGLPSRSDPARARGAAARSQGGSGRTPAVEDIQTTLKTAGECIDPCKKLLQGLKEEVEQEQRRLAHVPSGRPVQGTVTSPFGVRRSPWGRGTEYHEGIDIAAPSGTAIKATGAGTVIFSGWRGGYGYVIEIDHGYGYKTVYAHNSKNKVSRGSSVRRGDIIAYVGSTGWSTGPHVHYEVIYQGVKKNPANYF
ncbi:MAG: M23 family metallopeptidase [Firmicutes bacterium]|nr:M23 family metallopeptidase [Bacillota bacterium]